MTVQDAQYPRGTSVLYAFTLQSSLNEGLLYIIEAKDEEDAWTQFEQKMVGTDYRLHRDYSYNLEVGDNWNIQIGDFLVPDGETPDIQTDGLPCHSYQIRMGQVELDQNVKNAVCW